MWALSLTFGVNSRGGPDTRAAAAALGVSQSTVYRWIRGQNRWLAKAPAERLDQIARAGLPPAEVLRHEEQGAQYAREAIERIALPKHRGVLPAWREQNWLEPHLVAVVGIPGLRLRQIAVSRIAGRQLEDLRRRGAFLDYTTVPTRFHATILVHELLTQLRPWRIQAPETVKQGRTQTWADDAPDTNLDALAVTHDLR